MCAARMTGPRDPHDSFARMQNPRNLKVRKEAMRVAVETYHLTATFPGHELYGMVSQMRRASVSIGSNISEGCGRQGDRAMIAYLHQAMGSLDELEFQLELAIELGYSRASDASVLGNALLVTKGMMTRLLASLRQRVRDHESRGMGP